MKKMISTQSSLGAVTDDAESNGKDGDHPSRGIVYYLAIAFGLLVATFFIGGGFIFMNLQSIRTDFNTIVNFSQPISASAYEMEINVIGSGMGVLKYLQDPKPEYWDRFEEDKKEFSQFLNTYFALSRTQEQKDLGRTVKGLFEEYSSLGLELMQTKNKTDRNLLDFNRLARDMELLLD